VCIVVVVVVLILILILIINQKERRPCFGLISRGRRTPPEHRLLLPTPTGNQSHSLTQHLPTYLSDSITPTTDLFSLSVPLLLPLLDAERRAGSSGDKPPTPPPRHSSQFEHRHYPPYLRLHYTTTSVERTGIGRPNRHSARCVPRRCPSPTASCLVSALARFRFAFPSANSPPHPQTDGASASYLQPALDIYPPSTLNLDTRVSPYIIPVPYRTSLPSPPTNMAQAPSPGRHSPRPPSHHSGTP
jgi:hypothetical protein